MHSPSFMRGTIHARAVFHDRAAMEEAVRALELEGIRTKRIRVSRADASGGEVRTPPEGGPALAVGAAIGAIAGGVLGVVWILGLTPSIPAIVLRTLAGAASGALLGALIALVVNGLRTQSRYGAGTTYRDYLVRVDTPDAQSAENVLDLLARAGGDPLPLR